MKSNTFIFESFDNKKIFTRCWLPENFRKQRGLILIAHGMAEHSGRYSHVAKFLTFEGYGVYAHDQRGHGNTIENDDMGYFGGIGRWNDLVKDIHFLLKHIKNEHPRLPVFVLGHSMGSILMRCYIAEYKDDVQGLILSGLSGPVGLKTSFAQLINKVEMCFTGEKGKAHVLNKIVFNEFNKHFKPARTPFDWLSSDPAEVDKYIADPLCGNVFSSSFFHDLLLNVQKVNLLDNQSIPAEIPILLLSGDCDPVSDFGKGVVRIFRSLKDAGVRDCHFKLYHNCRHEIFNETIREEVFNDIVSWLNDHKK